MLRVGPYSFKRAESKQEFEQVHRLNHRPFVDEIPQHPPTGSGILVDKFHHKNVYLIVLRDDRVVGMVSTHDQPPFSIADRLPDPKILYDIGTRPLEVRLLAIEPGFVPGRVQHPAVEHGRPVVPQDARLLPPGGDLLGQEMPDHHRRPACRTVVDVEARIDLDQVETGHLEAGGNVANPQGHLAARQPQRIGGAHARHVGCVDAQAARGRSVRRVRRKSASMSKT